MNLAMATLFLTFIGCTFHAGLGGSGAVHSDGKSGNVNVPRGALSATVGAGPCIRWPRLRASLTADLGRRVGGFVALGAGEAMWIFRQGTALDGGDSDGHSVRSRESLALKGRMAGGWNALTSKWIAEASIGLALIADSDRYRIASGGTHKRSGDFHALSADLIASYVPDQFDSDEIWLGGQITYHTNVFSLFQGGKRRASDQRYTVPSKGQSTDCDSGHLP